MKKLTVALTLLALLPVAVGQPEFSLSSNYPVDYGRIVDWQRRACEICGKTIWEKAEYTSRMTDAELAESTIADRGVVWECDQVPARIEAEQLSFSTSRWVCPHCLTKYSGAQFGFQGVLQKAADEFIAQAKEKESKRRAVVAQENIQEELRRVEAELRQYNEQVKKLTEKLEGLRKTMEAAK